MRRIIFFVILLYALSALAPVNGGQFYGGKGYLHTNAALLLPPGALDLSFYARGYTTQIPASTNKSWTYLSNGTSTIAASFGFTRKLELGFTQILYQDLNLTYTENEQVTVLIPGDTYIRLKMGGWSVGEKGFFSLMPALRYRVGKFHDIYLEPYESDAVEPEITMIYSYYWKPLYPDEDKSLHFNVGYLNHNDHEESPTSASQEVNYLVSFIYPFRIMDFGFEFYGTHFVKQPPVEVLGREDWAYITPMVRYKPFKGLQFTMGLDMLLLGYINTSVPTTHTIYSNFPNYSKWRVSGRINFAPSTSFYISPTFVSSEETAVGRTSPSTARSSGGGSGDFYNRQDLFRWAIEGQVGGVDAVNLDLEKLRQERMKAEAELKELKKRLESKNR